MAHAILFGELSGREVAEFLKTTLEHDGTVGVRPTPTDAETVVYQRSLADPAFELTVEAFRDGTPSRIYDGARTEVLIGGDSRGMRGLARHLAEAFGGLVQVHEHWEAVPGNRPERLAPKARLCVAVFGLLGDTGRFPAAAQDRAGLAALRDALDAYLAG